ncbi:hypothetical protein [Actinobacillus pleuropneumoniae]|uniref:hypothetical protein n=1 Tax=Actinobacillus pleuropneumoniae TaxID=715 RepID=UPI003F7BC77B
MNKIVIEDEFYIAEKTTRIAFLKFEIQKIKNGNTKGSPEILKDALLQYEKELELLNDSEE